MPSFLRRSSRTPLTSDEWERDPIEKVTPQDKLTSPIKLATFTWSTALPNAQGWWWNRAKRGGFEHRQQGDIALNPTCVYIFPEGKQFYMLAPDAMHYRDVRTFPEQEWAGPIPEPRD